VFDHSPGGETSVTGDSVTIDLTFLNGSCSFTGTLEADGEISGNITVLIQDRGTVVSIQSAPAILAPVPEE
jgi:hypothetical protein